MCNLTQQVMKNQPVVQILLQTLNHDVLRFQSAIDPINQCLTKHNSSHSQTHFHPLTYVILLQMCQMKKQHETQDISKNGPNQFDPEVDGKWWQT